MIWLTFKNAVKDLLTVDATRQGVQTYIDAVLRLAVIDIQRTVDFYQVGHETFFTETDLEVFGEAHKGLLPDDGVIQEAWIIYLDDLTADTTVGSAYVTATAVTTITSVAHGLETGQYVLVSNSDDVTFVENGIALVTKVDADNFTISGGVDGSGILDWAPTTLCKRTKLSIAPWRDRDLFACANVENGIVPCGKELPDPLRSITISPKGKEFIVFPQASTNEREYLICWDGIKLSFDDTDSTPFDEDMTLAVSYYVKSELDRQMGELAQHQSYLRSYGMAKRNLFVNKKEQTELVRQQEQPR